MVRLYTNKLFVENVQLYLRRGYQIDREEAFTGGIVVHMSKQIVEPPSPIAWAKITPAAIKPQITLNQLDAIDVRVGTVLSVEDVPGADKLVALRVSFGDHERTIVAGLKTERADPREIVGKQALFIVNLPPRKMKGVLSEGMLFDIGYADGLVPALAMPERPMPDGARAG
jgi:tRNA-binding protein